MGDRLWVLGWDSRVRNSQKAQQWVINNLLYLKPTTSRLSQLSIVLKIWADSLFSFTNWMTVCADTLPGRLLICLLWNPSNKPQRHNKRQRAVVKGTATACFYWPELYSALLMIFLWGKTNNVEVCTKWTGDNCDGPFEMFIGRIHSSQLWCVAALKNDWCQLSGPGGYEERRSLIRTNVQLVLSWLF